MLFPHFSNTNVLPTRSRTALTQVQKLRLIDCPLTLPPTIARSRPRPCPAPSHFCVTPTLRTRVRAHPQGDAIMDVNRRHLIGASAAGVAGAIALPPEAARAAPLT